MSGGGYRVSIPAGVRRTIQNIKEIAGNHSDDEIYALLKECGMDPNETAQKLLLQDTFHEVRRKCDKRKENVREPTDARWRPGVQGRGGRGGRGKLNYSSHSVPSDDVAGRNVTSGKENGLNQGTAKANTSGSATTATLDTDNNSAKFTSRFQCFIAKVGFLCCLSSQHPSNMICLMVYKTDYPLSSQGSHVSGTGGIAPWEESSGTVSAKSGTSGNSIDVLYGSASGQSVLGLDHNAENRTPAPVFEISTSISDLMLVTSPVTCSAVELGTTKQVTGIQHSLIEIATRESASRDVSGQNFLNISGKGSDDMSSAYMHGKKIQIKPQGSKTNELTEKSVSSFFSVISSRQSSAYNNRPQLLSGSQKAPVPNKEWKPKSVQVNPAQASEMIDTSDILVMAEAVSQSLPASCSVTSEETTMKLEKKLDELKLSDRQHVIIPNHLQVPESERHGLSFGSFDENFDLNMVFANGPTRDKIDTPPFESSQEVKETSEQPSLSIHMATSAGQEAEFLDHPQSPELVLDSYPTREANDSASISTAVENDQCKQEASVATEGSQNLVVQSAPSYPSFGLDTQVLGSQFVPFESSEPQARDTSRLPNFLVQQPYDPSTSYYTPFYRPIADADGCISPLLASSASSRYNGNTTVLPARTVQASQENTNSVVLSMVGSTPLATQAAGPMQGSVAIPQQPVPVFRQPPGLHISHYPPNYIQYSQYFSPFYVPPPTLHHFLSGAPFPQQPPTGSIYPTPGATSPVTAVKYTLPQYKPGANTGNSTIVGLQSVYGTYNATPAGYASGPAASSGNSTSNEDLGSSQFKENNVYIPGQQSEGPAVWIPAPGRDISALQASSFYSIPSQGQHMTFAPTQAGHGAFSGVYPPTPTVAAPVHPLLQQSQTVAGAVEIPLKFLVLGCLLLILCHLLVSFRGMKILHPFVHTTTTDELTSVWEKLKMDSYLLISSSL
ncbi:hypothetical protein OPV22_009325 [Ensete ventricosum]|uniref:GBF-interacting protein 1 N-terminal domain-containing protein n=1 Tax=Ensete ventricosum TaxID=4639 RepID=A0AAV8R4Y1_ENSVE|nr:hypothetical protein OPV22_009325 [Ensete ventricosum]